MNNKHKRLHNLASKLLRIGGAELTAAAGLVSAALEIDQIHPETEHALYTELWGYVTRALDVEDFAAPFHDEVESLEAEMAGHVLAYRLARGWLVRGTDAPSQFQPFSDAIKATSAHPRLTQ